MDVDSGFLRDAEGLRNIYRGRPKQRVKFSAEEYGVYASVFTRARELLMAEYGLEQLYFTAPTFITRTKGGGADWEPPTPHDLYYATHVDQYNTDHYAYSALVYLSTFDDGLGSVDAGAAARNLSFTGGRLRFVERGTAAMFGSDGEMIGDPSAEVVTDTIEPRAGRLATFTSGPENPHHVEKVLTGTRIALSMWFTCDPEREFEQFLNGKVHRSFRRASEEPRAEAGGDL